MQMSSLALASKAYLRQLIHEASVHTRAARNHTGTFLLANAANASYHPSFNHDKESESGWAVRELIIEHHPEFAHMKGQSLISKKSPFGPMSFELKVSR